MKSIKWLLFSIFLALVALFACAMVAIVYAGLDGYLILIPIVLFAVAIMVFIYGLSRKD